MQKNMYYRVLPSLYRAPSLNHHDYGFEDRFDFQKALAILIRRYGGLVGECVGTRHAFYQILFVGSPYQYARVWIPRALCEPVPPPALEDPASEEDPLENVLGEGW